MKRKLFLILGPLCILFLVAYAAMIHITNSINRGMIFDSQTVKGSREVSAFKAEYKVESASPLLSDSLSKYGLSHIDLSKLEFWIEQEWGTRYEYLFFKKIYYREGNRLLITDPSSLGPEDQFYPLIKFAIKNTTGYSEYNSSGTKILRLKVENVPPTLMLGMFIQTSYGEDESYIGDIIIKKKV